MSINDFSNLTAKEFDGEFISQETAIEVEETVELPVGNDMEAFLSYMNSDKPEEDLEQYEQDMIPTENKPNGNMADIIPAGLSESKQTQKETAKKTEPKKEEVEEKTFAEIMNNTGFHFDEKTGILEF